MRCPPPTLPKAAEIRSPQLRQQPLVPTKIASIWARWLRVVSIGKLQTAHLNRRPSLQSRRATKSGYSSLGGFGNRHATLSPILFYYACCSSFHTFNSLAALFMILYLVMLGMEMNIAPSFKISQVIVCCTSNTRLMTSCFRLFAKQLFTTTQSAPFRLW